MRTETGTGVSKRSDAHTAGREAALTALSKLSEPRAKLGMLFVSPEYDLAEALKGAHAAAPETRFVGCTTAGEITERGLTHGAVVVMVISGNDMDFEISEAEHVDRDRSAALEVLTEGFERQRAMARSRGLTSTTSVLLVDGINGCGEELVDDLVRKTGSLHDVVGGAAGDEGVFKGTYVGRGGRSRTNGAVCVRAFSRSRWGIGVDHGLTPATDMMLVTRAEGAVVYELDGRPAFDVYREFAARQGVDLDPAEAGAFLINNELGIHLFGQLQKARAPLHVGSDGSLRCAAKVPQGSSVCIMGGSRAALVGAAKRAAQEARHRLGKPAAGVLLFDCICRGTILGDQFQNELDAVRSVFPQTPVAGFLTYGEIARYAGRLDGWHNTTAVVVAIPA